MSKVKFDKEETKNLLSMLTSSDEENATVAFQAIENADLTDYIGELIVLFKYSKISQSKWETQAPKVWLKLQKYFVDKTNMSSGRCLSIMTDNKASKESLELYLEYFVTDMMGFLEQLGYPADRFNINIELRNEQTGDPK